MGEGEPFRHYAGLSTPVVILDGDYRIVYLNPSAEAFWRTTLDAVRGEFPSPALHLGAPGAQGLQEWRRDVAFPALATGDPFTCRSPGPDGRPRIIRLSGTRFAVEGSRHTLLTVLGEAGPEAAPEWALTDPLTGLHNRHQWEREAPARNARAGVVLFLDLDDLKQLNDLAGHRRGDEALVVAGRAIAAHAPPGALVVRYGGDEFVLVLQSEAGEPDGSESERTASARALAERICAAAATARADLRVALSYGVAPYAPGGLAAAVERADEALYERRGVLLRGAHGGRIVLTGAAAARVLSPGAGEAQAGPGEFGKAFAPEFGAFFRQSYARSVQQAREFVQLAAPRSGEAAVEVGAGSGRIAFDGGLAEAVGPRGQLLLTDASGAQLQVARRRAEALGLPWVRFLTAPAEDLPLASNTVDLVVGAVFLHFTDERAAIRSMARIARPGGRVALFTGVGTEWGPAWERGVAPIRDALRARGLPFRDWWLPQEELEALCVEAGLRVRERVLAPEERLSYPTAEVAVAIARQASAAALLLRPLPEAERRGPVAQFEHAFRGAIEELGPRSADVGVRAISLVATKTG